MKAILVMDMPESCENCHAGRNLLSNKTKETWACEIILFMKDEIKCVDEYEDCKPDWCPLKSLPDKKEVEECFMSDELYGRERGWNDCIDDILKGSG